MKKLMENWNKFVAEGIDDTLADMTGRDEANQDFQIRFDAMTMLRDFLNELPPTIVTGKQNNHYQNN